MVARVEHWGPRPFIWELPANRTPASRLGRFALLGTRHPTQDLDLQSARPPVQRSSYQ
jgi:hypothetical protein